MFNIDNLIAVVEVPCFIEEIENKMVFYTDPNRPILNRLSSIQTNLPELPVSEAHKVVKEYIKRFFEGLVSESNMIDEQGNKVHVSDKIKIAKMAVLYLIRLDALTAKIQLDYIEKVFNEITNYCNLKIEDLVNEGVNGGFDYSLKIIEINSSSKKVNIANGYLLRGIYAVQATVSKGFDFSQEKYRETNRLREFSS